MHSKAEERDLKRELLLASTADHPNIVRHLCAYYCEDAHGDHYVWIAMEMMAHGALNTVLDRGWRQWVSAAPAAFNCSQPCSDCWVCRLPFSCQNRSLCERRTILFQAVTELW